MGDKASVIQGKLRCVLPPPTKQPTGPIVKSHAVEIKAEDDAAIQEEKEMIKEFIFPLK